MSARVSCRHPDAADCLAAHQKAVYVSWRTVSRAASRLRIGPPVAPPCHGRIERRHSAVADLSGPEWDGYAHLHGRRQAPRILYAASLPLQCSFEGGSLAGKRFPLAFETLDHGAERFGLAVQCPHGFGVALILPLLAEVAGPAHAGNPVPDGPDAYGGDSELPDCNPFGWRHSHVSLPIGWRGIIRFFVFADRATRTL